MRAFSVTVHRLTIEPHPDADLLELACIGGYRSIVPKGAFRTGDLAAYIPEGAVVPDAVQAAMGVQGKLAGKEMNRVKAIRLRGVLSQGLVLAANSDWAEGQDVAETLGITKYVPPVPVHMAGEVYPLEAGLALKYDIENFKRHPQVIRTDEPVVMTEKLHGTFMAFVVLPQAMAGERHEEGIFLISRKGLLEQGLALKHNEANANNLYLRAARQYGLYDRLRRFSYAITEPLYLMGEVYGDVQDLKYGHKKGEVGFRVFDMCMGRDHFLNDAQLDQFCRHLGLNRVPVLYRGPFSQETLMRHTEGRETVSGGGFNIREGVVVRPLKERCDPILGRVILKSVSQAYSLRKNGTELN